MRSLLPAPFAGAAAALLAAAAAPHNALADPPRALPEGGKLEDHRLGALRNLDGYFPFEKVDSAEAWAKRSAELRRQVMVASGVWLAPTKTPLNAQVYGAVDRPEYTVERVQFESFPGHFVTGSLYRPKQPAAGERGGGVFASRRMCVSCCGPPTQAP